MRLSKTLRNRPFEDRNAPHVARIPGVVEGYPTVHCLLIVPHDDIADTPLVTIDERRLCCMRREFIQQSAAVLDRPTGNM